MKNVVGIRRETVDDTEHRAPLSPEHVRELVERLGIDVVVQPSPNRTFPDAAYAEAGARLDDDLGACNVILGVKEIAPEYILPEHAYCFFSHTIKAQRYNMPMLAHILESRATLVDYELVRNDAGRRLIFFGDFAGYAGMIDALWALGRRLDAEGLASPLTGIEPAWRYASLEAAERAVARVGERIRHEGLPDALCPLVCAFTGRGHVARGAMRIFSHLPVVRVRADDVPALVEGRTGSRHAVYAVALRREDLYARTDGTGGPFDREHFEAHPEAYRGRLDDFVPWLTMLVHGIYWEPRYPRLLTREGLARHWEASGRRLRVIADITCDIGGSLESTVRATTSRAPLYVFEPATGRTAEGVEGDGPVVLAVDKLPAELPRESTVFFGSALMPLVPDLARADFTAPWPRLELPPPLRRAVIAHRGQLTEHFRYLNAYLLGEERR